MKRRQFLGITGLIVLPFRMWANERRKTPSQTEGPFYPVSEIPVRDNLIANDQLIIGETFHLSGKILNPQGAPISGVRIEIWQCDGRGIYDHPRQSGFDQFDAAFLGYGAGISDEQGRYQFKTLMPVPYTGRPPHIHVKLWQNESELLTSQLYLRGNIGSVFNHSTRKHLQIDPQKRESGLIQANFDFTV